MSDQASSKAYKNTDREIWRGESRAEWGDEDRYYADSIHVTADGEGIGLNCGGTVIVKPIREWFKLAQPEPRGSEALSSATVSHALAESGFVVEGKLSLNRFVQFVKALAAATAERTPWPNQGLESFPEGEEPPTCRSCGEDLDEHNICTQCGKHNQPASPKLDATSKKGWRDLDLVYQRGWQEAIEAAVYMLEGMQASVPNLVDRGNVIDRIRSLRPSPEPKYDISSAKEPQK